MRIKLPQLRSIKSFCDPAGRPKKAAELKRVRARTAIVTVGADWLGRVFVLDAWANRASTEIVVTKIFDTYGQWVPSTFGVEANAMQELFAGMLALQARQRGVHLPIAEVRPPGNIDKLWRIRTTLQPLLARGQLIVRDDLVELLGELRSFPTGRTVDILDATAYAIGLLPARSVEAVPEPNERDQIAAYLARAGVSPDLIAMRLARYEQEVKARPR